MVQLSQTLRCYSSRARRRKMRTGDRHSGLSRRRSVGFATMSMKGLSSFMSAAKTRLAAPKGSPGTRQRLSGTGTTYEHSTCAMMCGAGLSMPCSAGSRSLRGICANGALQSGSPGRYGKGSWQALRRG